MPKDKLGEAAKALGVEHGAQRASWVTDSMSTDIATKILAGHDASSDEIMALCPEPLSGEWADDPTPMSVLDEIANRADLKNNLYITAIGVEDDVLDLYEKSFHKAFWTQVLEFAENTVGNGK